MELTKEQEKILKDMMEKNETKTIYVCDDCNKRLVGMKNVRKHLDEKKHYCYSIPGIKGGVGFL